MESVYARISGREYCQRTQLLEWHVTSLLERGKFLPLLHSWTRRKFPCSASLAVAAYVLPSCCSSVPERTKTLRC